MSRNAVQPRHWQSDIEHPAAVVLAVVDRVNDLPVTVKGEDHHAGNSAVHPERLQRSAVNQDAQSHRRRAWAGVVPKFSS